MFGFGIGVFYVTVKGAGRSYPVTVTVEEGFMGGLDATGIAYLGTPEWVIDAAVATAVESYEAMFPPQPFEVDPWSVFGDVFGEPRPGTSWDKLGSGDCEQCPMGHICGPNGILRR